MSLLFFRHEIYRTLRGFIDNIDPIINTLNRTTQKPIKILKFIVNNGDGCRIQCLIWNDDIPKFEASIAMYNVKLNPTIEIIDSLIRRMFNIM